MSMHDAYEHWMKIKLNIAKGAVAQLTKNWKKQYNVCIYVHMYIQYTHYM